MKTFETVEVTRTYPAERVTAMNCDQCGKLIKKAPWYTAETDRGSGENEYHDLCSKPCALKFARNYFDDDLGLMEIRIRQQPFKCAYPMSYVFF